MDPVDRDRTYVVAFYRAFLTPVRSEQNGKMTPHAYAWY
jgi:hypothetical protein